MKQKAFFIIFEGLSLKQIKIFFFLESDCPTLTKSKQILKVKFWSNIVGKYEQTHRDSF